MTISERILKVLKERKMTQAEFAKRVGISPSTICEWKKRKMNPSADKIMDICNVLQGKGLKMKRRLGLQVQRADLQLMTYSWLKTTMGLRKSSRNG